jgi:hypothetical protein
MSRQGRERPNYTHADGQTDVPAGRRTGGIQVRLPHLPPSQSPVRYSSRITRYPSTHTCSHINMFSPDSQGVHFLRADPLGLGLEPQNLSTYLPKEPP